MTAATPICRSFAALIAANVVHTQVSPALYPYMDRNEVPAK